MPHIPNALLYTVFYLNVIVWLFGVVIVYIMSFDIHSIWMRMLCAFFWPVTVIIWFFQDND